MSRGAKSAIKIYISGCLSCHETPSGNLWIHRPLLKSPHSARGKGLVWVGNLGEAAGVTGVQAVVHVGSALYVEGDTF